jgi:hypothetical protein
MATTARLPETLQEAAEYFADPDNAHAFLSALRWPDGIVACPHCGAADPLYLANQRRWKCRSDHPRRQFSIKVGTIFEDSPIALKKWLLAVWLIANCKNGISSYELGRAVGVTQKTAWFMNHRIRLAMQATDGGKLGGEVEVDETYIGGKARNMHAGRREKAKGRGTARPLSLDCCSVTRRQASPAPGRPSSGPRASTNSRRSCRATSRTARPSTPTN